MSERRLYQIFKDKITKADPDCFWYKIPDCASLGGMRPFDGFLVIQGVPFAIEFKSEKGKLTKYQAYQLQDFILAGGQALVYWEGDNDLDKFIKKIMEIVRKKGGE